MAAVMVVTTAVLMLCFLQAAVSAATWCVARSDAGEQILQTALDYACGAGADCAPIQPSGLCFLPNTVQAHASYAFNSFYQRKAMAAGSCDFSATATVAKTDPSYGSCVYPSSQSTAGGTLPPGAGTTPTTFPITNAPPSPLGTSPTFGTGGVNPGMGPVLPDAPPTNSSPESSFTTIWIHLPFYVIILFIF